MDFFGRDRQLANAYADRVRHCVRDRWRDRGKRALTDTFDLVGADTVLGKRRPTLPWCLVNARHAKNRPGRNTDIADCQWLQKLHTFGLLNRMLKFGQQYVDKGMEQDEARFREQRLHWLQRQARALTLQLVPNQPVPSPVS